MTSYNEQLQTKRWTINLYDDHGELRDNYRYAVARELPLKRDLIVLIVRGPAIEHDAPYLDDLVASIGERAKQARMKVVVYAWKGFWEKWQAASPNLTCMAHDDKEKPEVLARAGAICVLGYLPNYVIRRPDQRIVQVWAEPKGLEPTHSVVSRGFTSQLLGTSHIVASSPVAMERVLEAYRMHNLYAGSCLVGAEDGSFADHVAELVTAGTTQGFSEIAPSFEKQRVLIYGRLKDVAVYAQSMLRMVSSFDYDRFDVTLLLSRQPGASQRALLDSLPPELRIICRTGRFSLTPERYVSAQMSMDAIQKGTAFEEWDPQLGEHVADGELKRLLGPSAFDTFIYCSESSALWYRLAEALPCQRKVKVVAARYFTPSTAKTSDFALPFDTDCQAIQEIFDAVYTDDMRALEAASLDSEKIEFGSYNLSYEVEGMQHAYTYHEQATAHGLPFAFLGHPDGSVRLHGSLLPLPQGEAEAYLVDATVGNAEQLVNAVAAYASGPWECIVIGECSDAAAKRLTTAYPQQVRLAGVAEHLSILSGAAESYVRHFIAYVADAHLSPNDLRTASDNEDLTVLLLADGKLSPAKESCRMTKEEIAAFMRHQTETIVRLAPRYA